MTSESVTKKKVLFGIVHESLSLVKASVRDVTYPSKNVDEDKTL